MVAVRLEYQGDLHCKAVHESSGTVLTTDAPKDNQGRGESFCPTDLVATALGSCILSVMGIMARSLNVDITGTTATVDKEMATGPVRMIHKLIVKVHVPHRMSDENRQLLETAAHTCPVHKSMHPDVQMPIEITYAMPSYLPGITAS
jgi:putative redox protein